MGELLERERDLVELGALAEDACAGTGRLAVVEAAAGLGKTRLLQAARELGRDAGLHVLAARATELERDFPFALVRQLFGPPSSALDEPDREALLRGAVAPARGALGLDFDTAAPDGFAVLHGLYWLTAAFAERRPLLLAVDDAHWSDAASLDYLGFLLPRLEELPVLLVVACRPDEAGAERSLARIATDASAHRLTPRALSPRATAALLGDALERAPDEAFAAACHEVSGGNPFLLSELAHTLAAEAVDPTAARVDRVHAIAPDRVTRTVHLRLTRLSPAAQALARALVVLGDDADDRLAAALADLDAEVVARAADELRAAAILDRDGALRFVHPLVRTALEAELPVGERRAAHARAAALLRAQGATAQQQATHLVATDARGERATAQTLLTAGREALAGGAARSAAAYLLRALREPAPADLRPALLDALLSAGIRAPDRERYADVRPELKDELARDPDLRLRWGVKISTWMIFNDHARESLGFLEDAAKAADLQDDDEHAFRLHAQLCTMTPQPLTATRARLAPYVERFPIDSESGRLAAALESEWHAFDGTAADATAAAQRALGADGRIFAEQPELLAPGRAVLALIFADELTAARRSVDQALAHARRRGAAGELVAAWWMSSGVAWAHGELATAEADIRQALRIARLGGLRLAERPLTTGLATLLVARGELDAAEAELEAGGMTGTIRDRTWDAIALFPRGLLRYEQGRFDEAATDFAQLGRITERWGVIGVPAPPASLLEARALGALGDRDRARPCADAVLAAARRWGAPTHVSRALRARALTLDGEERVAACAEGVALLDGSPARLVRAEALTDLGVALRRARRDVDARPPLREALALARACGATGLAKTAFDELSATGEHPRRYTPIGAASLTPSQRRVAELAATGLTNRQIAQTLFLTVKTIESHLAAAYDTLGIASRQALPAALGSGEG